MTQWSRWSAGRATGLKQTTSSNLHYVLSGTLIPTWKISKLTFELNHLGLKPGTHPSSSKCCTTQCSAPLTRCGSTYSIMVLTPTHSTCQMSNLSRVCTQSSFQYSTTSLRFQSSNFSNMDLVRQKWSSVSTQLAVWSASTKPSRSSALSQPRGPDSQGHSTQVDTQKFLISLGRAVTSNSGETSLKRSQKLNKKNQTFEPLKNPT